MKSSIFDVEITETETVNHDIHSVHVYSFKLPWKTSLDFVHDDLIISSEVYKLQCGTDNETLWQFELEKFEDFQGTKHLSVFIVSLQSSRYPQYAWFEVTLEGTDQPYKREICYTKFTEEEPSHGLRRFIPFYKVGTLGEPGCQDRAEFSFHLDVFVKAYEPADGFFRIMRSAVLPIPLFNANNEPPNLNAVLKYKNERVLVDPERLNYYTSAFENRYATIEGNKLDHAWDDVPDLANIPLFNDVTPTQLKRVIQFCHEGKLDQNLPRYASFKALLKVAHKLEIVQLKKLIENAILKRLDINNFADVLYLVHDKIIGEDSYQVLFDFLIENLEPLRQNEEYQKCYKKLQSSITTIIKYGEGICV